eukprot:gene10942-11926_t
MSHPSAPEVKLNVPGPVQPKIAPHWTATTLNHISIPVSNLEKSVVFYDQVMATIGFTRIMTMCETVCYGIPNRSYAFWLGRAHDGFKTLPPDTNRFPGVHICLQAPNRKAVDDFYKTALKLGATDEGKPGIRSDYTPDYYAAFIIDPDGWKIEVVYLDAWYFIFFRAMTPSFYFLLGAGLTFAYLKYLH